MPNPRPKRPPKITDIGLEKHIRKQGWDYDLFNELLTVGVTAGNVRTALKNRRGSDNAPSISTVKTWIDIWLTEHKAGEIDV